jgi:S-adenosylmethionine-diacylglycerol 3-amino-3-carboxypropyl transferase
VRFSLFIHRIQGDTSHTCSNKIIPRFQATDDVLVITSAGCNALDYVIRGVNSVQTVDLNYRQNALLELKLAGARSLDYEDYFQLFGRGFHPHCRKLFTAALRPLLSAQSARYWEKAISLFEGGPLRPSFYFRGSSGVFATFIRAYLRSNRTLRRSIDNLLCADTLEDQREIYQEVVKPRLWRGLLRWVLGRDLTLAMVGVPQPQREQIDRTYPGGVVKFIEHCLDSVFSTIPLKDNYFWRVYLTGSYLPDCCPSYLTPSGFKKLKDGGWERVSVATAAVADFLATTDRTFSIYILLDHMDWLSTHPEALREEWQQIVNRARSGARIIWRSGGLRVDFVDPLNVTIGGKLRPVGSILKYDHARAAELHTQDRVHTYGSFYISSLQAA